MNQLLPKPVGCLAILALSLLLPLPARAGSGNAIDRIDFGNLVSEGVHNFMPNTAPTDMAVQGVGAYNQTYREPLGSGNNSVAGSQTLTFTMGCDPNRQNYLSVKLWGNDANCQMYLYNSPYPNLDTSGGAPVFPNRFFYYSTPIPMSWTQGKTSVQVTLLFVSSYDRYGGTGTNYLIKGQLTRPVYSAFTHADPCFVPDSGDVVGTAPTRTGTVALTTLTSGSAIGILQANRQSIFNSGKYYDTVLARQVPSGTAGAPPEVIGLDFFSNVSSWAASNSSATPDTWRNKIAYTKAGAGYTAFPDELLTVLCTSFLLPQFTGTDGAVVSGLDHYHDTSLIPKMVAAIDGASYLQDSDGGFVQQGSEWTGLTSTQRTTGAYVGSTARQPTYHGGGDLQGIDTYALGWTLINILNDPVGGPALQTYLGQSYDADLNGGSMLRAYAWERMLFNAINWYSYGTGGAESQNMFQMVALYASQIALQKLQGLYPNSSYVVSSTTYNAGNYLGNATPLQAAEMVMGLYPDTFRGVGVDNNGNTPPATNYGMTRKGLGEERGALSCGFDGGYGLMLPWLGVRFAQLAAWDPNVDATTLANFKAKAHAAINAWDQFISPLDYTTPVTSGTVSTSAFSLAGENFITYRNNENPNWDAGSFILNTQYMACDPNGVLNNAFALRSAYLQTQYGVTPTTIIDSGVANEKGTNNSLNFTRDLAAYENSIRSLIGVNPSTLTALPGEPGQPDYAWADVQAGAVAFNNNGERFYMNANWRNYEFNNNSFANLPPSQVARIHYTTSSIERAATTILPYNSATVQGDLNLSGTTVLSAYAVRYGNYLVVLNSGSTSYTANLPAGYGQAKELLSGSSYNLGSSVAVSASNAGIFWLAASGTMTSGTGAPTVATAAAASSTTVTGTSVNLSVLGADNGGEGNLTYTWSLAGSPPDAVTFSANGTNAAKNTTATFATDGVYNFVVVMKDAGGLTAFSSVTVTVTQTATRIGISPSSLVLASGQSQELAGMVYDQFGLPMQSAQSLTWTLSSGVGALNPVGLYSAPSGSGGTAVVQLNVGAMTATATITVLPPVGVFNGAEDIGSPSLSGSASLSGTTYTLKGGGSDIWGTSDQFQYSFMPLTGDGTITARVVSETNTNTWAKAGVMFRNTLDATSAYAAVYLTPTTTNGVSFQYRSADSSSAASNATTTGVAPAYWVRLVRSGDTFTAYSSPDGVTWTQLGTTLTISMNDTAYVGLLVCSHNTGSLCTASFDNVSITQTARSFFSYDTDIGSSSGAYSESGTTATLTAKSADIWGTGDNCHFAYTGINGNGSITARVVSQTNTNGSAKAGVMIRNTLDAGSIEVNSSLEPSYGANYQGRNTTSASTTAFGSISGLSAPYWVRLVRSGNSFSAYSSADGATWTQVGASQTISSAQTTMLFGLNAASNNTGSVLTAVYDNISVTGTVNIAPTIAVQPSAAVNGLSATLNVLGADDAGESNLTYNWYVLGEPPGDVALSDKDDNSAKTITASFGATGTYYLQVIITDAGGLTVSSNILRVVAGTLAAPLAPTGLLATGSNASALLSWSLSGGATSYNVKRTLTSGSGYSTIASGVTSLSYSDSPLTNGTNYYYVVSAVNAAGESPNSAQASVTPRSAPTDYFTQQFASGANTTGSCSFTFTPAGNVNGYLVSRATGVNAFSTDPTGGTALPGAQVDDGYDTVNLSGTSVRLFGKSYSTFYVGSNGYLTFDSGDSSYSGSTTDHFKQHRISVVFTDLNATNKTVSWKQLSDRVVVTWQNVVEFSRSVPMNFQVEMFFDGRIKITLLAVAVTKNTSVIGLSNYTSQPTGFANSTFSAYPTAPTAPGSLAATGSNALVSLSWSAVSGATGYNVKRSLTSGTGYSTIAYGATGTTFKDISVINGTPYYYVVSTLNNGGESPNSTQVAATPLAPPTITSASALSGTVGSALSYQIAASSSPTSFSATGLPPGLSVNTGTGLISGTPSTTGTTTTTLSATNGSGTGTANLTITVVPVPPVITSASSVSGTNGTALSYQIIASGSPSSFGASGLPAGLSVNTITGFISGTPSATGTSTASINATNAGGTGSAALTITVLPAHPSITSAASASGTNGSSFTYQITASNSPSSYAASGLPSGLSVNTTSGLISGIPTATGTTSATISATNAGGTGAATLTITVLTAPPAITSAGSASATIGSAFTYQITASGAPTSFGASGLPAGLSVNTTTGAITGTPSATGTTNATVSATNATGTGSASLVITVYPTQPVITSPTSVSGTVGNAFSYQITASSSPTSYGATGLPAGLNVNTGTGLISGTPSATGTTSAIISATNGIGSGNATLTITVVAAPPKITSAASVSGTVGNAFSYQITANGSPTSFGASGLPAGLSVDPGTGLISGTPSATGTTSATMSATNLNGTGTAPLTITAVLPAPPSAPSGLTASAGYAQVGLNWTGTSGVTGYDVKRTQTSGSGYTIVASNIQGTSYNDAAVVTGTTYYYVLAAVNAAGEGANSTEASAILGTTANWNLTAPGAQNWEMAGNWLNAGTYPTGTGISAVINANLAGDETINLNQTITVGSLSVGDVDGSNSFTLAGGVGGSLILMNAGSATLTQLASSKGDTLIVPITLGSNLIVTNNSPTALFTLNSPIMEGILGKTVTFSGTGTILVGGENTYTGSTSIAGAKVMLGVATSGTFAGAFGGLNKALTLSSGASIDLNNNDLGVGLLSGTGAVTNSGTMANLIVGNNNTAANLNFVSLSGSLSLVMNGTGWVNLSNTSAINTHKGGTIFTNNGATAAIAPANRWYAVSAFGTGPVNFNGNGGFFIPSTGITGWGSWANNINVSGTGVNAIYYDTGITSTGTWTGTGALMIGNGHSNTLTLAGNLTGFQGSFLLNGGTNGGIGYVSLSSTSAIGAAQAVFDLVASSGTATLQWNGGASKTVPIGDLNTLNNGSYPAVLRNNSAGTTATFLVGVLGLQSTYAGTIINGPGTTALIKTGTGTWTLTGSNSFSGGTTVSDGTLMVNNTSGSALGTGTTTVSTGATLSGTGSLSGAVIVNGLLSPGALTGSGTLTLNSSLTIGSGGALQYTLGAASTALASVNGNLILSGSVNVCDSGSMTSGTYRLINYTGSLTNNGLALGSTPSPFYTYHLDTSTANQVNLIVTQIPIPSAPTGLTATPGNNQVLLNWNASSAATTYNVSQSLDGTNWNLLASGSGTTYLDTSTANWTTYYYVVTASNIAGTSGNSAQVSATPQSPAITSSETTSSSSMALSGSSGTMTLKSSVYGHTYQLQYTDSLASGTWTKYGSPQPGTGGDLQFTLPYDPAVPQRFFRIFIEQ